MCELCNLFKALCNNFKNCNYYIYNGYLVPGLILIPEKIFRVFYSCSYLSNTHFHRVDESVFYFYDCRPLSRSAIREGCC